MDSALPLPQPSETHRVDVAVIGAGPVGALAALVVANAGLSVALVAPERGHDPRTSALLMPSVALLDEHGVWADAAGEAAPLHTIRIIDQTGYLPRAPEVAFDAHEIGPDPFGFNITNDALNAALSARLKARGVPRIDALAEHVDGTTGAA